MAKGKDILSVQDEVLFCEVQLLLAKKDLRGDKEAEESLVKEIFEKGLDALRKEESTTSIDDINLQASEVAEEEEAEEEVVVEEVVVKKARKGRAKKVEVVEEEEEEEEEEDPTA